MLALLGLCTIALLLACILTKRLSPLVALIVIPVAAALLGGFGLGTGKFVLTGLQSLAPVVGMFVFAILFFGIVSDAGLLDPIIDRILATVGTRPSRIVPGTTLLALLIHLDGSGAVTFLITIPAMLPLYDRVGIDRRILACAASLAAGVNFLPWTGPMIRASAALKLPIPEIFSPLVPVQAVGLVFIFAVSYWLGLREERRLKRAGAAPRRPSRSAGALSAMLSGPCAAGPVLAEPRPHRRGARHDGADGGKNPAGADVHARHGARAVINYPSVDAQRQRIDAHAKAAVLMASILLAAGVFTGIMQGTGMLKAMAQGAVAFVPPGLAPHIPFALGLVSMPLSMLFDPDSFYFGVLPVVAEVAHQLGVPPLQVAQGALLGQMTTGFPVSPLTPATFLVCGLCGIDLADHQKFTFPFLLAASVVMTFAAVAFGCSRSDARRKPSCNPSAWAPGRLCRRPDRARHRARRARRPRLPRLRSAWPSAPSRSPSRPPARSPPPLQRPAAGGRMRAVLDALPQERHPHRHQYGRRPTRAAAAEKTRPSPAPLGLTGLTIAAVIGDDVLEAVGAATTLSWRPAAVCATSSTW